MKKSPDDLRCNYFISKPYYYPDGKEKDDIIIKTTPSEKFSGRCSNCKKKYKVLINNLCEKCNANSTEK